MYLISAYSHNAAQLTKERKEQIRRNEQICQEQYEPPQIFRLSRVGKPRILEQGDVVLGKVKIVTTKKIACQIIYVIFKGVVKVDFNVPSTTMIDEIQRFKNEWEFFSHKIPVFMHEQRGYNFLEPGVYEFYWKARVPIDGPCSFNTDIASVSYRFSGVFVRNDVTADVLSDNQLAYFVRGYKDLNQYDGARIGWWQERRCSVGGLCGLFSGQVFFRVRTDKRAFVSGEKIVIIGKVSNNTWRNCTLRYELVQNIKMWGEHFFWRTRVSGSRNLEDKLVMEKGEPKLIFPGDDFDFVDTLIIPKGIEPSYMGPQSKDYVNDLINLEYRLMFEIDIPYSTNLRLTIPLIIGTEPFTFLPDPPKDSSYSKEKLLVDDDEEREIELGILDFGHPEPLKIPRFHPLNKHFQRRFPETFRKQRGGDDGNGSSSKKKGKGLDGGGGSHHHHHHHHQSTCDSSRKPAKQRHRSTCRKMMKQSERTSSAGKPIRRATADHGHGIPLEDSTYNNWLSTNVDDYLDEEGKQTNLLLNVMKEYGLVS